MQKIKQHPFIASGILVVIVAVIAFIVAVWKFGWDWTGFTAGASKITISSTSNGTTTATELQPARTLWDWLGLLATLAIPVVVGLGAAWFTAQQGKVSDAENTDNQRETALQAYIDKMSELLLHEKLRDSAEEDEVRNIARVRTLTVLRGLDAIRKASVLQFLYESSLIAKSKHIIDLNGADLRGAELVGAFLNETDLSGADFREADLREADLKGTILYKANLSRADLSGADLNGADLRGCRLIGTNLYQTDLSNTDLRGSDLNRATPSKAIFYKANLKDVTGITIEELEKKAKSLKGTTKPDGSKHP